MRNAPSTVKFVIAFAVAYAVLYVLSVQYNLALFTYHDSRNTAWSGFRLSSAIAPARQNQLSSS